MTPHAGRRLIAVACLIHGSLLALAPARGHRSPTSAQLVELTDEVRRYRRAVCDLLDQLGADTSDPASVAACTITDQSTPTTQEHHP